jgi:cytosine/adenosine deaminase-related metal-dependent hydrolase
MILRARVVLPMSRPPIEDGAVWIVSERIRWAGRWRDLSAPANEVVVDTGESVLLPGLVNAHCHLDYTDFVSQIPPPKNFPDWIKAIVSLKAGWSYTDFAQSWLRGANMLLRNGVTTVADIEAVPELLPQVSESTPLRLVSFLELISVKSRHSATKIVDDAIARLESLPGGCERCGLSPHAPYTTSSELLQHVARVARQKELRVTTHVAESAEEVEMFAHRRGALFDWLRSQRDMSDCGLSSPVRHLERNGLLAENLLAVHVNYLARGDAQLLGERGVSVVHCPRSHAYFGHQPFPCEELRKASVNLCLGTDSLATVKTDRNRLSELDLWAEMRAFAGARPTVTPETILAMATIQGAKALGMGGQIGEISESAFADLIAIPFAGKTESLYESVLHHAGPVTESMIAGQWAIQPNPISLGSTQ